MELRNRWQCAVESYSVRQKGKPILRSRGGLGKIAAIIEATLQTKPAGMTHWSCRTLAEQQGVSKSTVNNIWRAHNLQPHRTKTFKLSRDPKFLEKMTDVVGLYLNPPQKAIVLCVDERVRYRP
jgi:hypothetical protein